MTQDIRESWKEFNKEMVMLPEEEVDMVADFFLSHHNTTLKEIEEGLGKLRTKSEEFVPFQKIHYQSAIEEAIKLIHQKLIK